MIEIIGDLVRVQFEAGERTFNRHNLIHERDIYLESMRAEHDKNYRP